MKLFRNRWGTKRDIDTDLFKNIILSKMVDKNVFVYGAAGSNKAVPIITPNLRSYNSSYVVIDLNGRLLNETGNLFYKKGYRIKIFDLMNFNNSMKYNPFHYIQVQEDILTFTDILVKADSYLKEMDSYYYESLILIWLRAALGYLWYEAPEEKQNMPTLLEFYIKEQNSKKEVDMLFKELEQKNPNHFAVEQREIYNRALGFNEKAISHGIGAILSPFDSPEVRNLVTADELEIDTYGDKGQKTILYVIISDTDTTYNNSLLAILITQMFNVLCYKADKEMGGKLYTPVQFISNQLPIKNEIWEILLKNIFQ